MTYSELVEFCGSERQAYFISQQLPYRKMTAAQLEDAVCRLLVRVKEAESGPARLEYINGQRRDIVRNLLGNK